MPVLSSASTVMSPVEAAVTIVSTIFASRVFFRKLMETVPAPAYPLAAPAEIPTEPVTATIRPSAVASTVKSPVWVRLLTFETRADTSVSVQENPMAMPTPALPPNATEPAMAIRVESSSAVTDRVFTWTGPVISRRAASTVNRAILTLTDPATPTPFWPIPIPTPATMATFRPSRSATMERSFAVRLTASSINASVAPDSTLTPKAPPTAVPEPVPLPLAYATAPAKEPRSVSFSAETFRDPSLVKITAPALKI